MPYTMADFQQLATDPLKKAVINTWRKNSLVMDLLPWTPSDGLSIKYVRTLGLPSPAWRKIGAAFADKQATTEPVEEQIYLIGAKIDIPKEYVKAKTVVDQRKFQSLAITQSIALGFNDAFINGSPADVDSIVGLWYRLVNDLDAAQTVDAGNIDISPDATTLSVQQTTLLNKIDELMDQFDDGSCDVLFMNDVMKRRLVAALRAVGGLDTGQDAFGRKFMNYGVGGPRIVDIGRKYDQSTRIIGNVENVNGAVLTGGAATSIYGVKFGEPYLAGFFLDDLLVDDVGLIEARTHYRTVIDWSPGIYLVSPRSVGRIHGIVAA